MRNGIVRRWKVIAGTTLGVLVLGLWQPASMQNTRVIDHVSGRNVVPVFDGYEVNPDGTYSMWFGYFNRNREQQVEIPIGPNNQFEPGPADRGQPTHFMPVWQKSMFRVVVPKDFGESSKLIWRLTVNGQTEIATATLNRRDIIDRQKETLEGGEEGENLPPKVTIEPSTPQTVTRPAKVTYTVSATDDGKPQNLRTKKPDGLNVRWRKYRGPTTGQVTFMPEADAKLVDGKGTTSATFSEPGEYVLQAVVDDSSLLSGTYCCWISTELKVTVK